MNQILAKINAVKEENSKAKVENTSGIESNQKTTGPVENDKTLIEDAKESPIDLSSINIKLDTPENLPITLQTSNKNKQEIGKQLE